MQNHDMTPYLAQIIDTMNEGLMIVSPEGRVLMVNCAFETITGYGRGEALERPCTLMDCDTCDTARSHGGGAWCRLFERGSISRMPCHLIRKDGSCVEVLKNAVILRAADGSVLGAVETLTDISELSRKEQRICELSRFLGTETGFCGLVGKSDAMRRVFDLTEKAARSDAPVIIHGESGTGKELTARAVHELGKRRAGPFIQFNCAALNEALLESELFGHVKGAFTGAFTHRQGRFEAANGGDIFLDEIGDIPLATQVKLLRVLESKQFERVGDLRPVTTDVRIITATNRDLASLVREGRFREDLYFRINVIPIHLPPLRERTADIPLLVRHFVGHLRQTSGKDVTGLDPAAMKIFFDYAWPGNVRELKSAIEYAFVVTEGGLIAPGHLPPAMLKSRGRRENPEPAAPGAPLDEKEALIAALRRAGGNQSKAAALLGVSRVTVWHRMKRHGVDVRKLIDA